ncbi:hypothetical protein RJT34_24713 [Clitoria ternatea]|uniref:Uncharacterized protein n=1 Tax=Clitoria ternatea TaxID=43366 RepID=A0AAN9FNE5_CLITE
MNHFHCCCPFSFEAPSVRRSSPEQAPSGSTSTVALTLSFKPHNKILKEFFLHLNPILLSLNPQTSNSHKVFSRTMVHTLEIMVNFMVAEEDMVAVQIAWLVVVIVELCNIKSATNLAMRPAIAIIDSIPHTVLSQDLCNTLNQDLCSTLHLFSIWLYASSQVLLKG